MLMQWVHTMKILKWNIQLRLWFKLLMQLAVLVQVREESLLKVM